MTGRRRASPRTSRALAAGVLAMAAACMAALPDGASSRHRRDDGGPIVRVALATADTQEVQLAATGPWRLYDRAGLVAAGSATDQWRVERRQRWLRVVRADGTPGAWREGAHTLRVIDADAMVRWHGRRFRGELLLTPTDSGMLVVNRLPLEQYLRGVVPLEIGQRQPAEHAAIEAQAVAARSYMRARLDETRAREYDLAATVLNQIYGGADAERPLSDAAIEATSGLVLQFGGRAISAPYHSTCGGSTAEAPEVWRAESQPYLRRVSDRIPGSDRFYCDLSPRFRWERTYDAASLAAVVERWLRAYAPAPAGSLGAVRAVASEGTTPSGRVSSIAITTDRGTWRVRGNDVRFVLRSAGGELLNSTYFSLEPIVGREGRLTQLTIRGLGNGHGVGMCQWGAIGRARVGQDYRTILQTYYPGTTIGRVD